MSRSSKQDTRNHHLLHTCVIHSNERRVFFCWTKRQLTWLRSLLRRRASDVKTRELPCPCSETHLIEHLDFMDFSSFSFYFIIGREFYVLQILKSSKISNRKISTGATLKILLITYLWSLSDESSHYAGTGVVCRKALEKASDHQIHTPFSAFWLHRSQIVTSKTSRVEITRNSSFENDTIPGINLLLYWKNQD